MRIADDDPEVNPGAVDNGARTPGIVAYRSPERPTAARALAKRIRLAVRATLEFP